MKQYSVPIGIIGVLEGGYVPLSPAKTLVFTFPASFYGRGWILIYAQIPDLDTFLVSVPTSGIITVKVFGPSFQRQVPTTQGSFENYDENVVIRMDLATPGTLNLYVNEKFVSAVNIPNSNVTSVSASSTNLSNSMLPPAEVTLTAFDQADSSSESAARFAEGMRNPLDPQGARQREIKREVDAAVADREKAVQAREDAVALREAAVNSGGGGAGANNGSPSTINPPDASAVNLSATFVWRFAVHQILGPTLAASVQAKHDALMASWVIDRGDNISSTAYDYQVYSTGITWPKAVLEATDEDKLADVQKERGRILKSLSNLPSYGI